MLPAGLRPWPLEGMTRAGMILTQKPWFSSDGGGGGADGDARSPAPLTAVFSPRSQALLTQRWWQPRSSLPASARVGVGVQLLHRGPSKRQTGNRRTKPLPGPHTPHPHPSSSPPNPAPAHPHGPLFLFLLPLVSPPLCAPLSLSSTSPHRILHPGLSLLGTAGDGTREGRGS